MDIDTVETVEQDLQELFNVMTRDAVVQIRERNDEILNVVRALGGNTGKYQRERRAAIKAVVSEIYSPPRVTAAAKLLPELKIIPGFALDLTGADSDGRLWDVDDVVMRERVKQRLLTERPMLLVGSPMCTAFSTWQRDLCIPTHGRLPMGLRCTVTPTGADIHAHGDLPAAAVL